MHRIHRSDITNHVLREDLQDATDLLVDEARNALYTSTASKATNSRHLDAMEVVMQHLMPSHFEDAKCALANHYSEADDLQQLWIYLVMW